NIKGSRSIIFSVVRYGNVMGSRGSVIPFFLSKKDGEELTITDSRMTRFNITLNEAVDLVIFALENATGGEIFVPKLPSYKITDLAKASAPKCKIRYIGIRPGEKLHEEMVTLPESINTYETKKYYIILPSIQFFATNTNLKNSIKKLGAKKVKNEFSYSSGNNKHFLKVNELKKLIDLNILSNGNYTK
ncbi:MAG: polysaccharide biosynthesis protein, partial [Bacteroidales bacterium]|nr:polysaccharide biosynthesis protein [Bacteroidales bacterium]